MASVTQTVQPRTERDLQITASCPTGKDLRVTVERFDGFFYDPSDGTFKALGSITDPYVALTENPGGSGNYELTLSVTDWTDGNYNTDLWDFTVDPLNPVQLEDDATIFVDGGSGAPTSTTKIRIDQNYGAPNALCYVDGNGNPVEGADIYAFTLVDYDADASTLQAIAKTQTDADGNWVAPFFLDPGQYVILFHKPDEWGPDTSTITVI